MTQKEIVNGLKEIHDQVLENAKIGIKEGIKKAEEKTGKKRTDLEMTIIQSCCEVIAIKVTAGDDRFLVGAAYAFAKEVSGSIIAEMTPEGLTGEKDEQ